MTVKERIQEYFDEAYKGLRSQGFLPSYTGGVGCLYRFEDRRCAIGWLIPDAAYNEEMEGRSVDCGPVLEALGLVNGGEDAEVLGFLLQMQDAHDNCADTYPDEGEAAQHIEAALADLATKYGLTIPA